MECFVGAELFHVGSFNSNKLSNVFENKTVALYKDDLLGAMKQILYSKRRHIASVSHIQDGGKRSPYHFSPLSSSNVRISP